MGLSEVEMTADRWPVARAVQLVHWMAEHLAAHLGVGLVACWADQWVAELAVHLDVLVAVSLAVCWVEKMAGVKAEQMVAKRAAELD